MDEDLLHDVVAAALRAGADAAEAVGAQSRALSVASRKGELEEVEREESRELSLRVFVGGRPALGLGLRPVGGRPRQAGGGAPWPWRGWRRRTPTPACSRPIALAAAPFRDFDLHDEEEPFAEALEELARRADAAAWEVAGVTNTDGGSASWSSGRWRLVTSAGFSGAHAASSYSASASAIAGEGGGDGAGRGGPHPPGVAPTCPRPRRSAPRPGAAPSPGWARARSAAAPRRCCSRTAWPCR